MRTTFHHYLFIILTVSIIIGTRQLAFCQEILFNEYNLKNGLPSSETYQIVQDTQGLIWIASDGGLTSYDGYQFKTYTVQNGLPENVVLKLFTHPNGDIWFVTSSSHLGYVRNGIVKTLKCGSIGEQLEDFSAKIVSLGFDENDVVYLGTNGKGCIVRIAPPYEQIEVIDRFHSAQIDLQEERSVFSMVTLNEGEIASDLFRFRLDKKDQKILDTTTKSVFKPMLRDRRMTVSDKGILVHSQHNKFEVHWDDHYFPIVKLDYRIISFFWEGTDTLLVGMQQGGFQRFLINESGVHHIDSYLKGYSVSSVFRDRDGHYWVTTLNNGLFYVPSLKFKRYRMPEGSNNIISLKSNGNQRVQIQTDDRKVYNLLKNGELTKAKAKTIYFKDRIFENKFLKYKDFGEHIVFNQEHIKSVFYNKIVRLDSVEILQNSNRIILLNKENLEIQNLFHKKRIHDILLDHKTDNFIVAINNNIYSFRLDSNRLKVFPLLENENVRVNRMCFDSDQNLWIATKYNGVLVVRPNGEIVRYNNGLPSLNCSDLKFDDIGNVWVSTNKGLFIIDKNSGFIQRFSFFEEANDNEFSELQIKDSCLYIATKNGVIELFMLDVLRSIRPLSLRLNAEPLKSNIKHPTNNFQVSMIGVTYWNGENLKYRFRLDDENWQETDKRTINLFGLDPGEHEVSVLAMNSMDKKTSDGTQSSVRIEVSRRYYQTWFFWFVLVVGLSIFLFCIGRLIVSFTKKREQQRLEDEIVSIQMNAKMLRAQMTPHFLFNALNSIQSFIYLNKKKEAINYLSKFSNLMRGILEETQRDFILLQKEVELLSLYMDIECMRFSHRFSYSITIDENLMNSQIKIPTMMVQPHIENAILHGLQPIGNNSGVLKINFFVSNDKLTCEIIDNGIGRKASAEKKKVQIKHHESVAIELAKTRISSLNKLFDSKSSLEIIDLTNENGTAKGTIVILTLPYKNE